jgi:hypothetical protein
MLLLTLALSSVTGGLLAEHAPAGVYLVEHGALAQADAPPPPPPPSVMPDAPGAPSASVAATAAKMRADLEMLEDSKPSIAGGLTMTIIGGVGTVAAIGILYFSLIFALLGSGGGVFIAGLVTLGIAVPILVVGIILMVRASHERRAIDRDMSSIRQQLRTLEHPPVPAPNSPTNTNGPSPLQVRGPDASMLIAAF